MFNNRKLIELPKKGKALVITDIHGNIDDYNRFMDIWENFRDRDNHLIQTGDLIHGMDLKNDKSIEILDSAKYKFENSKNFHLLLGNHEWSLISKTEIYKAGINLTLNFETLLKQKFGIQWEDKLENYIKFFKKLPVAVKTGNKVFISHAGPPRYIDDIDEIIQITNAGYSKNRKLFELLWNRYGDYTKEDIDSFLENTGCNAMMVGHAPVNGVELTNKRQLVVASSYTMGKRAYVKLDLERKIKNGKDLLKMVKYLD
ncbi:MAG: metallophosphoesterase [Methanothermobacter sp.]|jgi:serine/threonine-protein phosphatase PP1 catalytic subunit|nr:metallophosphoesterase [Methanothermobacter sp.]